MMARVGRPTTDPKASVLTVRVASRHMQLLERRAAKERITLSEALRRYLDEIRDAPTRADAREAPRQAKPRV